METEDLLLSMDDKEDWIRGEYLRLNDQGLLLFAKFMALFHSLLVSLVNHEVNMPPPQNGEAALLYMASACGAFKTLRVCHKLLLFGYFLEMHATMRMLTEWLKGVLIALGVPHVAGDVLRGGVKNKMLKRLCGDLAVLRDYIQDEFEDLSKRAHITSTTFALSPPNECLIGGIHSEKMFANDSLEMAKMTKNTLEVLTIRLGKLPTRWRSEFAEAKLDLERALASR